MSGSDRSGRTRKSRPSRTSAARSTAMCLPSTKSKAKTAVAAHSAASGHAASASSRLSSQRATPRRNGHARMSQTTVRDERQRQQQPRNPGRRTLIGRHAQPLQRPLPPAADRLQAHRVLSRRQAGRDRDPARRGQRIVQRQVGRARLVAGQRVGRLAVHADPVVGPVGSALDAQIQPGTRKSKLQRVTVRAGIGGVRRHAPAAAVAQRGMIDGMLAGRQHRGRRSGPGQRGPHRPRRAAVAAEGKAEPGIIRRAVGAIGSPEERPQPRPVRACRGERLRCILRLSFLAHAAPGRCGRGQRVPAEGGRPQRRLVITVARHHLAQQLDAPEVEPFGIGARRPAAPRSRRVARPRCQTRHAHPGRTARPGRRCRSG